MRPGPLAGEVILAIAKRAILQRHAAAANAAVKLIAQQDHFVDASIEVFAPAFGQSSPVLGGRNVIIW
ncbi:hypothetical protein D3C81_2280210 [compost metagenome]